MSGEVNSAALYAEARAIMHEYRYNLHSADLRAAALRSASYWQSVAAEASLRERRERGLAE